MRVLACIAALTALTALGVSAGCSRGQAPPPAGDDGPQPRPAAPAHGARAREIVPVSGPADDRFRATRRGVESAGRYLTVRVEDGWVELTTRSGLGRYHGLADGRGLRLRLSEASRGEETLWRATDTLSSSRAAIAPDGSLTLRRASFEERWERRGASAEQSFVFAAPPPGAGDLVIRVDARGPEYAGATAGGLHFADRGALGFRFGHGTWIDASGERTRVAAAFEDGAITLRVPSEVVRHSTYPSVLDPVAMPEVAIDTDAHVGPGLGGHVESGACGPTSCMGVWHAITSPGTLRYLANRFSPDGTVLDAVPLQLAVAQATAHTNGRYFVAGRSDSASEILLQQVADAGAVSPPVSIAQGFFGLPTVACGPAQCLVAYPSLDDGQMYAARIDVDGAVLDSPAIPLPGTPASASDPAIAFNGTDWLVAWRRGDDPAAARVSTGGAVLDPTALLLASGTATDRVSAASNGTDFLVGWSGDALRTRVVSAAGQVGSTTVDTSLGPPIGPIQLAWSGGHYGAVASAIGMTATPGLYRFPAPDSPPTSFSLDGLGRATALAQPAQDGYLVFGSSPPRALRFDDSLSPQGGWIDFGHSASPQERPAIARGATEYLAVWRETREGEVGLYGARLLDDGTALDAGSFLIASSSPGEPRRSSCR